MEKNEEIVQLLQADLKGELQGIRQYVQGSQVAKGLSRQTIAELLMDTAKDEMHHYDEIAKQIVLFGGVPDTSDPLPVIEDPDCAESMRIGVRLETTTIAQYTAHRDRFDELGEAGLVQIIETIMDEEQGHLTEYKLTGG